jgi:hypothetical protein
MIGQRVVFLEDFEFNGKVYKKGHQFTITGDDNMRGLDLDDNGSRIENLGSISHEEMKKIGETRFMRNNFEWSQVQIVLLSKLRDDKLKELGI